MIGSVKAGQGVLCLYFAADLKSGLSHLLHTYTPETELQIATSFTSAIDTACNLKHSVISYDRPNDLL